MPYQGNQVRLRLLAVFVRWERSFKRLCPPLFQGTLSLFLSTLHACLHKQVLITVILIACFRQATANENPKREVPFLCLTILWTLVVLVRSRSRLRAHPLDKVFNPTLNKATFDGLRTGRAQFRCKDQEDTHTSPTKLGDQRAVQWGSHRRRKVLGSCFECSPNRKLTSWGISETERERAGKDKLETKA